MFDQLSEVQRAVLRLAVVASGALLVGCLLSRGRARPSLLGATTLEEERSRFVSLLGDASRRFFIVCMGIQKVARKARANIQAGQVEVTEGQIRRLLAQQCKVQEQLKTVITEVLGCSSDDFHELQLRHRDQEVRTYLEGFEFMMHDAIGGVAPMLTNVKIPDELTEDLALQILGETFTLEAEKIVERVGGQQITERQLSEVLSACHREACVEAVSERVPALAGRADAFEVYYSALALYMKREGFPEKRQMIDEIHQRQHARMFSRPEPTAEAAEAPIDDVAECAVAEAPAVVAATAEADPKAEAEA